MNRNRIQLEPRQAFSNAVAVILVLLVLIACDTTAPLANSTSANLAATATPFSGQFRSSFDATKAAEEPFSPADDTRVAAAIATRKIELALTPSLPPSTPLPPQPSPTWELGMLPGCQAPNSHTFGPVSCWRGIINGQMFSVVSGNGGGNGDPSQGVIIVSEGPDFNIPLGYEEVQGTVYDAPDKIGPLRIASVEGSQVTLTSVNPDIHETFVFDIVTRQFLPPSCGQGGTCTPTVTQVATQVPTTTAVH